MPYVFSQHPTNGHEYVNGHYVNIYICVLFMNEYRLCSYVTW
jgi:hypothetical protein